MGAHVRVDRLLSNCENFECGDHMIETVIGVVIGGLLGVGGTLGSQVMATRHQKNERRREEMLPVASRVLKASRQAIDAIGSVDLTMQYSMTEDIYGTKIEDHLKQYKEARAEMDLSLYELSLLIRNIDTESENLRNAMDFYPGVSDEVRQAEHANLVHAREAFLERLRKLLGT